MSIWELILVYAGSGVVTAGLLLIVRSFWKTSKEFSLFARDWNGEPERPGVPARPGIMLRLSQQDEVLEDQTQVLNSLQEDVNDLKERLPKR